MEIKIDDIKVSQRLRQIDDTKVYDLMESIQLVGLLHPILVDSECNLLAGNHRLEAMRLIGCETIECKQVTLSDLENELVQIDENLIHNDLNLIEQSEHIIMRESILEDLGKRVVRGDNRHVSKHGKFDTFTLAEKMDIPKRKYQRIKQISKINETARIILKNTDISNNLDVLLLIERLHDESLQIEVATRIDEGHTGRKGYPFKVRQLIKSIQNERKQDALIKKLDNYKNSSNDEIKLFNGDFRNVEIEDNSIDMIFTDPPYITDDSLELYEGLSELGKRVLKEGGSCLCYLTPSMLHDVLNVMSKNLDYYWILTIMHDPENGNKIARHSRGIFMTFKPILWFVKGKKKRGDFLADLITSPHCGKQYHIWEQSQVEADYYISYLSDIGDTILDPMMGSGTTGVSANQMNRKFIGIEKEKRTFDIATSRINEIDSSK